jgi:hypothetical protein
MASPENEAVLREAMARAEADALHKPGPRWVPAAEPSQLPHADNPRQGGLPKDPASMGGSPRGAGQ